jgi:adenylate cyclase
MKGVEMEAPPLERRLAAILAADVEGYSRLMHADEETTLETLSARRAVIDELIARHKGRIANTAGDSVLAEFVSVLDAVRCAIEIQQAVAQANDQELEAKKMRFRIGINMGDVMVKQGDIFGDGVNVAARLEGLVKGGEICVSRGVRDHLRHRAGIMYEDLGEQLVKNIVHPIRAFRLRLAENKSGEEPAMPPEVIEEPEPAASSATISDLSADTEATLELAFWESVKDGTCAELETYLDKYPEGTFAALARTKLEAAERSPSGSLRATAAERDLSADTEAALELTFWESVKDGTHAELETYLDRYPEGTFAALARTRLEAAERSPAGSPGPTVEEPDLSADTEAALELAFWESVKDGTHAELETYLDKYPDGTFAALARTRLTPSEQPHDGTPEVTSATVADEIDLTFWNSIKDGHRPEELQAYLEQHPNGHFAALARARLSSPGVTE